MRITVLGANGDTGRLLTEQALAAGHAAAAEVTTQVRDQFRRDQIHTVPASKVVVSFPVTGTTEMLDYQASTFSFSGKYGRVSGGSVIVEIVERTLNADTIRAEVGRVKQDIDKRAVWANSDLASFEKTAEQSIRTAFARRKERILNDHSVEDSLGIPVRTTPTPRPPVPARRAHVTLQARTAQAAFVPEPVLEDAIYQDVLQAVRAWATSLERTPGTAAKLDEEELRDLLLGNLNTYWQGGAGGELFNGSGKTDILIHHGDRNAFHRRVQDLARPEGRRRCTRLTAWLPRVARLEGRAHHVHQDQRPSRHGRETARSRRGSSESRADKGRDGPRQPGRLRHHSRRRGTASLVGGVPGRRPWTR
jgi:hypothetical protein